MPHHHHAIRLKVRNVVPHAMPAHNRFAQSQAGKVREAALRQQILTDPHSPSEFRADTVRNLDAWYAAFNVKAGQTLYLAPDVRVHIW